MADKNCPICGALVDENDGICKECNNIVTDEKVNPYTPAYASMSFDAPPPKSSRYSLISAWGYFGSLLIFCIPIVGFIIAVIWALGGCKKKSRRNLAIGFILVSVLIAIIASAIYFVFNMYPSLLTDIKSVLAQINIF